MDWTCQSDCSVPYAILQPHSCFAVWRYHNASTVRLESLQMPTYVRSTMPMTVGCLGGTVVGRRTSNLADSLWRGCRASVCVPTLWLTAHRNWMKAQKTEAQLPSRRNWKILFLPGVWLHMTSFYVTIVMHLRSYSSGGTTKFLTWTWTWTSLALTK